jgi:hypothetical protein
LFGQVLWRGQLFDFDFLGTAVLRIVDAAREQMVTDIAAIPETADVKYHGFLRQITDHGLMYVFNVEEIPVIKEFVRIHDEKPDGYAVTLDLKTTFDVQLI